MSLNPRLSIRICATVVFVSSVFMCPVLAQNSSQKMENSELRTELLHMAQKDQTVQDEIIRKSQAGETVEASDWARKDSVFLSHIHRAREIIEKHGWPGIDKIGEDGSQSLFLIVQHADADPAFQKKALHHLNATFEKGQALGKNVAYLTDRVRVAEGLPQVYGTQLDYDDNACPIPGHIENEENVDVLRAEVGMEPLNEYIKNAIVYMGKEDRCGE